MTRSRPEKELLCLSRMWWRGQSGLSMMANSVSSFLLSTTSSKVIPSWQITYCVREQSLTERALRNVPVVPVRGRAVHPYIVGFIKKERSSELLLHQMFSEVWNMFVSSNVVGSVCVHLCPRHAIAFLMM